MEKSEAYLPGYQRRFWQGSHDHRGTPQAPGRVVTLIERQDSRCLGVAYLIEDTVVQEVFEQLDHREKNGYERFSVHLELVDGRSQQGLTYLAAPGNFAYLGEAPLHSIATQIAHSTGPSGENSVYLFELARSLRELGADDPHIFELESAVKTILQSQAESPEQQ